MHKQFRARSQAKVPLAHASEHYGQSAKSVLVCSSCHCFYWKKAWHHTRDLKTQNWNYGRLELERAKRVVCPACEMVRTRQYAGALRIKNVPERLRVELVNLMQSYAKKAFLRDPQDRLVALKSQANSTLEVTTTDNQLAVRLAKKVKETFSKVSLVVSRSAEPYLTRTVNMSFV